MLFPIIIVIWIGLFWILSNFGIGGLYPIHFYTNFIVFLSLLFFLSGVLLSYLNFKSIELQKFDCDKFKKTLLKIYSSILPFIFTIELILLIKLIYLFINDPDFVSRLNLYGNENSSSLIFESQQLQLIYFLIVQSFIRFIVIVGFFLSYFNKNIKYILYANILLFVDSIIFLGRGFIIEFIFQLVFFLILNYYYNFFNLNRVFKLKILTLLASLILAGPLISVVRGDLGNFDLTSFFYNQVINYHTVGFNILDNELENPKSRLNKNTTYGLATLGGIERFFILIIRRFDKSIDSVSGINGEYLNEFIEVGVNSDGDVLRYNAFATIFYTFLLDGGTIFCLFASFICGFYISFVGIYVSKGFFQYIPICYLLFQAGFNSLFFSPIESSTFWFIFLALLYIKNTLKKSTSNVFYE